MRTPFLLMAILGGLLSEHQDPPANIKTDTEALGVAIKKTRRIEEKQLPSKRKVKQKLGKKNRKNRGKKR